MILIIIYENYYIFLVIYIIQIWIFNYLLNLKFRKPKNLKFQLIIILNINIFAI